MEVVKSRQRPRCADCGSSAVTLQGACVWHLPSQSWRAVQPELTQGADGAFRPKSQTDHFTCQDCEAAVGVRFGR
jgi:transposase-like protein